MEKRLIDTKTWINELIAITDEGYEVPLNITGNSMLPFLKPNRDRVMLKKFCPPAERGDILLYRRPNGDYVLHRVTKANEKGIFFSGDIQGIEEGPVSENDIYAVVSKAFRNGKWTEPGKADWDFFKNHWHRTLKLRRLFGNVYRRFGR